MNNPLDRLGVYGKLLERYGVPTISLIVLAIVIQVYWLGPMARERAQDRETTRQERLEDRASQKQVVEQLVAVNANLRENIDKFAVAVDKLAFAVHTNNELMKTMGVVVDSSVIKMDRVLEMVGRNYESITEAYKLMAPVTEERKRQSELLKEIRDILDEEKKQSDGG